MGCSLGISLYTARVFHPLKQVLSHLAGLSESLFYLCSAIICMGNDLGEARRGSTDDSQKGECWHFSKTEK